MANTTIQLKKSGTPSAQPSILANGEIAINYADGKLFYKDASGNIQQISGGGNNFSTINAAGTLVIADLQNDVLSLEQGSNIIITGDAINDKITIAANLIPAFDYANTMGGSSVTVSNTAPVSPGSGDLWWNTDYGRLLVYYTDADSSQWVDAAPVATSAKVDTGNTIPTTPTEGQLWWNSEYGRLFVYYDDGDSTQWVDTNPATDTGSIQDVANAAFNTANVAATYVYVNTSVAAANTWANTKLANTNVVLAGNLTSTQGIADRAGDLRNLPIVNQTSSYTLSLADNGEVISITTGNVFVTAGIFFPGNTVSIFNNSSANITITQNTSVTMYSAGTANTGNRILQQRGIATLVCVAANTFVVTGAGMVP